MTLPAVHRSLRVIVCAGLWVGSGVLARAETPVPDPDGPPDTPAALPETTTQPRVAVVPVVVGGNPAPDPDTITSVAKGLQQDQKWTVIHRADGQVFERVIFDPPKAEDWARLEAGIAVAERARSQGETGAAVVGFTAALDAIEAAAAQTPLGSRGDALILRAGGGLVQTLVGLGQEDAAEQAATRVVLLLPGQKFSAADGLSPVTLALLSSVTPPNAAAVEFVTRPDACQVQINGAQRGQAPLRLALKVGATYFVRARCVDAGQERWSQLRKIVPGGGTDVQTVMLDVEFENAFANQAGLPSGPELRFAHTASRRQLEPAYARRLAEALGVDIVVLVSLGELGGAEWANARLYLSSGFRNRQGLARVEPDRLVALGQYLASGKDSGAVLRSEEAAQLAAASRMGPRPLELIPPENPPWYTDTPGWVLTGVGVAAIGVGYYLTGKAQRTRDDADAVGIEFEERQRLRADAQKVRFWGNVGMFGGAVMVAAGAILLIAPEYSQPRSELFVLAPTDDGAGAQVGWFGRF